MSLQPPADWHKGVTRAMGELLGEQNLQERIAVARFVIRRMDERWDNGFITDEQGFIQQRLTLKMDLEQLTPAPDDE